MPVKPGRKAIYHLPVVFGTLFFALEYLLLFIYQSWLWLVIRRGGQIRYTPIKNNGLVHNSLSDKQYLYPPEFVPLLSNSKRQCMILPAIHISHFHFNLRTMAINEDNVSGKFLSTVNRRQVI